ncbi:Dual-specificity RNA methyltransferase RlmN [Parachlamydia sp. AcF125]|nr:23S rRNA (adenine(2503)-C(2))-methyltransferase RlmN [Parachlamydia sp. AcF125]MBS4168666.1 Dual-specificity RNA methyltransferase RlmN [Parachlamydia sp. AcF125]
MAERLGKGRVHASLVYQEFFRLGRLTAASPAFKNAQGIRAAILENVDVSLLSLGEKKEEGKTGKFLAKTHDGLEVEFVQIPMQSGGTLCISSQVGCRMGCAFCETGKMGLLRHLTTEEIVSQVYLARHHNQFSFRNLVFMGMGEPLDNYEAVMQAVRVFNDSKGFGFGRRRMTISTSGCVEGIDKLANQGGQAPNLAVSINAPSDELRNRLMPVNRQYDLKTLYEAMHRYCAKTGRQILIAYVLLRGQNDQMEHAVQLAEYLKGLNVKINLIPYNPQSRDRFQAPEVKTIEAFTQCLRQHGYYTLLRLTKGQDIMAACGQLGNLKLRKQLFENQRDSLITLPANSC